MTAGSGRSTATPSVGGGGPRVSGHAAATHSGKVLVHGGLTDGAGSPCTDELWSFDPEARAWSQHASSDTPHGPASGSSTSSSQSGIGLDGFGQNRGTLGYN